MSEPVKPALTPEAELARDIALVAMAAVCLSKTRFGFTREDVEVLRIAREAGTIEGGAGGKPVRMAGRPLHFGEQLRLASLADRIEALLPPK